MKHRLGVVAMSAALVMALFAAPYAGDARGHGHHRHYGHHYGHRYSAHRIHRSRRAKRQFEAMTGHPHGWPGHVIDHVKPLACGGADAPSNMQWQTIAAGEAKDKVERIGCRRRY